MRSIKKIMQEHRARRRLREALAAEREREKKRKARAKRTHRPPKGNKGANI